MWGGIHFRFATLAAARIGDQVADYVTSTQLVPLDADESGDNDEPRRDIQSRHQQPLRISPRAAFRARSSGRLLEIAG